MRERVFGILFVVAVSGILLVSAMALAERWSQEPNGPSGHARPPHLASMAAVVDTPEPTETPPFPTFTPKPTRIRPTPPPPLPTSTFIPPEQERSKRLWYLGNHEYLYAESIDEELFSIHTCEERPDPNTGEYVKPPYLLCEQPATVVDNRAWRWLRQRAGIELGPSWR